MDHMEDFEADARFEYARSLLDEQRDSEAEEVLSEIIDLYPDWEGAYGNRGLARMHLGRDEDAYGDFKSLVKLNPEDAMAHARMAEALRNLGKYKDALDAAGKAIDIDPDEPDAHYVRGWLFFLCRQFEQACDDFEVFVRTVDEAGEVDDLLAVCRLLKADPEMDTAGVEKLLRENGFSFDRSYNENFESEELFCPYAHCVRVNPARGPEALDACPLTGFACPGGMEQSRLCIEQPFCE